MRKAAGLTLKQAAELSGYTVGAINGEELHGNGSDRLREKLTEVYRFRNSPDGPSAVREGEGDFGALREQRDHWMREAKATAKELAALRATLRRLSEPKVPGTSLTPREAGARVIQAQANKAR